MESLEDLAHQVLSINEPGQACLLLGNNFSGRTDLLRYITGLPVKYLMASGAELRKVRDSYGTEPRSAYISPEARRESLSALMPTGRLEFLLNGMGSPMPTALSRLVEELRLTRLLDRDPFTLSGGEQTCMAITTLLALEPRFLAIDCPTEQLDPDLKACLFSALANKSFAKTATLVSDNRSAAFNGSFASSFRLEEAPQCPPGTRRLSFEPLNTNADLGIDSIEPCDIQLDDIHFWYQRGIEVLSGLTVRLAPAVYILDGRNGAGKTTLARLLTGARIRPRRGRLLKNGKEFRPINQPARIVAYHFQNPDLQLFATSVEQEIQLRLSRLHISPAESQRRLASSLAVFGLSQVRHEHPLDLPFVIRKRVALAATIAMGRPWVILDEPTLGQDDRAAEALYRIVTRLAESGTGFLIISHDEHFRSRFGARRLRLEQGVIAQ